MTANLLRIRRLVRARLGVPASDRFFSDDVIDDHINLAIETIDTEYRWPWFDAVATMSVLAGSRSFALPPDWRVTRAVFYNNAELAGVAPADLARRTPSEGVPEVWAQIASTIAIDPYPSSDIEVGLLYYSRSRQMENDRDELTMPAQFVGAVVAKAAELLCVREDDSAQAESHRAEYSSWLGRMRREVRRTTAPVSVRVRDGSWV